jgi:hypothetical protein
MLSDYLNELFLSEKLGVLHAISSKRIDTHEIVVLSEIEWQHADYCWKNFYDEIKSDEFHKIIDNTLDQQRETYKLNIEANK